MRSLPFLLVLGPAFVVGLASGLAAAADAVRITSGEFEIQLTANDLAAIRGETRVLSFHEVFRKPFEAFRSEQDQETLPCSYEHTLQMVSLAGPYLGVRDSLYSFCRQAAHPSVEQRLSTYDMAHSGNPMTLADLFPEPVLVRALSRDPVLAPYLERKPQS